MIFNDSVYYVFIDFLYSEIRVQIIQRTWTFNDFGLYCYYMTEMNKKEHINPGKNKKKEKFYQISASRLFFLKERNVGI